MIDSIDGLQKMDGLVKLSLQGNALHSVDVTGFRWCVPPLYPAYRRGARSGSSSRCLFVWRVSCDRARLEMLNMSHNRLGSLVGLASLPALIALNLGKSFPRIRGSVSHPAPGACGLNESTPGWWVGPARGDIPAGHGR